MPYTMVVYAVMWFILVNPSVFSSPFEITKHSIISHHDFSSKFLKQIIFDIKERVSIE